MCTKNNRTYNVWSEVSNLTYKCTSANGGAQAGVYAIVIKLSDLFYFCYL